MFCELRIKVLGVAGRHKGKAQTGRVCGAHRDLVGFGKLGAGKAARGWRLVLALDVLQYSTLLQREDGAADLLLQLDVLEILHSGPSMSLQFQLFL